MNMDKSFLQKNTIICLLGVIFFISLSAILNDNAFAKQPVLEASPELIQETVNELSLYQKELNLSEEAIDLRVVKELYHTDDTILGYYYHIYQNESLVGYVLISEKEELGTTIEIGSFPDGIDNKYGEILSEKPNQKAYYLSIDDVVIANNLNHLNNQLEKTKKEMIKELKKNNDDKELLNLYENFHFGIDIEAAVKEEEKRLQEDLNTPKLLSSAFPNGLSVPYLSQYNNPNIWYPDSACGPVAAAMIVKYYNEVRLLNVRNYPAASTLINSLYNIMNSRSWGTNQYSFHNGGQAYFNLDQNLFEAKSRVYGSSTMEEPSFVNVKNAIDKKYPLAVIRHADVSQIWSGKTGYHWTVIYDYIDSTGKVVYHDPATSEGYNSVAFSTLAGKIGYTYFALK